MISTIINPARDEWSAIVERPSPAVDNITDKVNEIIQMVASGGDQALLELTHKFDSENVASLEVSMQEIEMARQALSAELVEAIDLAAQNIRKFHECQKDVVEEMETTKGVHCWRETRPIEKVGLYIPGGSAPLFSTVLMLAIPASIAGCQEIILCTPPQKDGSVHPAILYAASVTGVHRIFKVGGAQAIGAMTVGTTSISKVHKIFGPGNHFVTEAKMTAQRMGVAIDIPAGPSELLVVADKTANPAFVAADMLSQAEHGPDSQVMLVVTAEPLIEEVKSHLKDQLDKLPRRDIAAKALQSSKIIGFQDLDTCMSFSNTYAPEHLILSVDEPRDLLSQVTNAGSVFLGHLSPESVGDYASGTNHTLPTAAWARAYSGVSLDSFVKKITFQELTEEGLKNIGPSVECMASAESLDAHKNAVSIRLKSLR